MTHIQKLLKFRAKPEVIRIAGGAAKSDVWVQMFADVLQIPIEITRGSELGAMGAAICAGVGSGIFESLDEGVAQMVQVIKRVEPDRTKKEMYTKKYNLYHKAIQAMNSFWA
jgi:L-xylulokinase